MTGKDLIKLGFKPGPTVGVALRLVEAAEKSGTLGNKEIRRELKAVLADPVRNAAHPYFSELARMVREANEPPAYTPRADPAPYQVWGDGLEEGATEQMRLASLLPVATAGALMPDAHVGYGLPIGGVLAADNAVIPYAVGVDIACRMRLSVYDVPADQLKRLNDQLVRALNRETKFGTGQEYKTPLQHDVLDENWNVTPVT